MQLRTAGLAFVLSAALAQSATAADFNLKVTSDGIQLGKQVFGPMVAADDLKNHVVFLEFWGVN